jgi:O-acetylserine/cysteine efflux transporter
VPRRHVLLGLAVVLVWGVNFVVIDLGLKTFPPLLFVALRFLLVVFPAVFFIPRPPIPFRQVALVGAFLSGGQFAFLFAGMHAGMPAGLASVVVQVQALFTMAFAAALLGEVPGRRQLAGAAIALGGLGLIAAARAGESVPVAAFLLCIAGSASWGLGNVVTRRIQAPNALALIVWSSLVVPIPLAGLSLAIEGPRQIGDAFSSVGAGGIFAVVYVAVVATGFGYGAWTWLLKRHPASQVALFPLLVPVIGIASAWIALGERPGALELLGSAVILAGLAVVSGLMRRPARRRGTPETVAVGPPA